MNEKPLFIPLKTEYFNAFKSGEKTEELRKYGKRWTIANCEGREVVLSKGYGNHERLIGTVWRVKKQHGSTFGSTYKKAIKECYGTLDIEICCISINNLTPVEKGMVE